jgi:hypothetical protein
VILAELELYHSRPVAPTRRVALGHLDLPVDPAPGFGGLLLGGVVAANMPDIDPELFDDLDRLTRQLEHGRRVPQPRLRHRFQHDRVGLSRSTHRLVADGEGLSFAVDGKASPVQRIIAAVYAAGLLPYGPRSPVMAGIRKAMRWSGAVDNHFVAYLTGLSRAHAWSAEAHRDPLRWALSVLNFNYDTERPGRRAIQLRFRTLLREAHPDHGGEMASAAFRIAELTEARRVLLAG